MLKKQRDIISDQGVQAAASSVRHKEVSSGKHVQGWTISRSTSTLTNCAIVDKIIDVLSDWTTPCVRSCVVSVPMFTHSLVMVMLYVRVRE